MEANCERPLIRRPFFYWGLFWDTPFWLLCLIQFSLFCSVMCFATVLFQANIGFCFLSSLLFMKSPAGCSYLTLTGKGTLPMADQESLCRVFSLRDSPPWYRAEGKLSSSRLQGHVYCATSALNSSCFWKHRMYNLCSHTYTSQIA